MIQKELEALLSPLVESLGCELWACEFRAQGKASLLRIYIDKLEGIQISDCERVSREVGFLLDTQTSLPGNYTLEVSSPGIERPLFKEAHFRRYLHSNIAIKLQRPLNRRRKLVGKLIEVDNNTIVILIEEDEKVTVSLTDIVKAHLVV